MDNNESGIKKETINNDDSVMTPQKIFKSIENMDQMNTEEKDKDKILKDNEINRSEEDMSLSDENSSKSSQSDKNKVNIKLLYEKSKKQIEPYQLKMILTIKNIEEMVKNGEKQRNYKMRSEFEREKEYKLEEQSDIKNQIEELSKRNIEEKLINHFNSKINQQEDLYNKYEEMKEEINAKIEILKKAISPLEEQVKEKNAQLKVLNKENLTLMDKINELENDNVYNNNNVSTFMNNSQYGNNSSVILNNSQTNNNQSLNILNNSDKFQESIKINEIVKENEDIRNQYNRILELKNLYKKKKKENQNLIKSIYKMNNDCFLFKKIFNEGMHEIGKELLKIHELKLDKIISGTNSKNSNSLYSQIDKDRMGGIDQRSDDSLKLPLINKNIKQKYNYPIVEKSNPNTLIYNVIKNILDENHKSSKITNIKKHKINWDDFKNFSAYQMYTILNMNKDIIKKIEGNLFPRKIIFSSVPTQEEESINLKNESEINEFNELNEELY
jgi:hypothetical protein